MATVDGYISAFDVATADELGATSSIERLHTVHALNAQGTVGYEVYADGVDLIRDSPPGTTLLRISFDGGRSTHARMIVQRPLATYAQDRPHLSEEGNDTSDGLTVTVIDRLAVTQAPLNDILTAAEGDIRVYVGDALLPPGAGTPTLPDQKGIFSYHIADGMNWSGDTELQFSAGYNLGTGLFGFGGDQALLDIVINRDTIMSALIQLCKRLGGATDPEQANYIIDSGDFAPGGAGPRSVVVGYKGQIPFLHFDGLTVDAPYPVLPGGTQQQPRNNVLWAGANFLGGPSNHGKPDGGTITDLIVLNKGRSPNSTAWDTCLPVVAIYASKGIGGVFAWWGDGVLHPMSQAMGVHALWSDEVGNIVFACTDAGLYTQIAKPQSTQTWQRIGNFSGICTRVQKDANGYIWLLAKGNPAGNNGVLVYPALSGPGDTGLGGWQWVWHNDQILDFNSVLGVLYLLQSDNPRVLTRKDTAGGKGTTITVSGNNAATKLDPHILNGVARGTFVLTAAGSAGCYYINLTDSFMVNNGSGLTDASGGPGSPGAPVMVNSVTSTAAGSINGNGVGLLAWTNKGMYESIGVAKPWRRTDGQSGLTDVNLTIGGAGPAQTVLGRRQNRIYASTGDTLYVSYNGSLHWVDEFAEILDKGPAWFAMAANGDTPPDNSVDHVGNISRDLDGVGHFTYTTHNFASQAPFGAVKYDEISEIAADSFTKIITASGLLVLEEKRWLAISSTALDDVTVESWTDGGDSLLLQLMPGHMVLLTADVQLCIVGIGTTTYIHYDAAPLWVLRVEKTLEGKGGGVTVLVTLCTRLISGTLSPEDQGADLQYKVSRVQLNTRQRR